MTINELEISNKLGREIGKVINKKLKAAGLNVDVYYGFNSVMVSTIKKIDGVNHQMSFPPLFFVSADSLDRLQPMVDDYCKKLLSQYDEYQDSIIDK